MSLGRRVLRAARPLLDLHQRNRGLRNWNPFEHLNFRVRQVSEEDVERTCQFVAENSHSERFNVHEFKRVTYLNPFNSFIATDMEDNIIGHVGCSRTDVYSNCLHNLVHHRDWELRGVTTSLLKKAMKDEHLIHWISAPRNSTAFLPFLKETGDLFETFGFYVWCGSMRREHLPKMAQLPQGVDVVTTMVSGLEEAVWAYDSVVRGEPRNEHFFRHFILGVPGTKVAVAIRGSSILGYGITREYRPHSFHLGPLYAENEGIARAIYVQLLDRVSEGSRLLFQGWQKNLHVIPFAKCLGDFKDLGIFCMLASIEPRYEDLDNNKIFLISSMECYDWI